VSTWLEQSDDVIATVMDIYDKRAADYRAQQRKRRKGA
jgi:hypothetical protein